MSTHNIGFYEDLTKIIFELSSNTQLISSAEVAKITKALSAMADMSRVMRKPTFCICENKDADQLRGNREADQHLCFRYTDSTIPLLPISEISSL